MQRQICCPSCTACMHGSKQPVQRGAEMISAQSHAALHIKTALLLLAMAPQGYAVTFMRSSVTGAVGPSWPSHKHVALSPVKHPSRCLLVPSYMTGLCLEPVLWSHQPLSATGAHLHCCIARGRHSNPTHGTAQATAVKQQSVKDKCEPHGPWLGAVKQLNKPHFGSCENCSTAAPQSPGQASSVGRMAWTQPPRQYPNLLQGQGWNRLLAMQVCGMRALSQPSSPAQSRHSRHRASLEPAQSQLRRTRPHKPHPELHWRCHHQAIRSERPMRTRYGRHWGCMRHISHGPRGAAAG